MINAAGREIPADIQGYKQVKGYAGAFATRPPAGARKAGAKLKAVYPGENKLLNSIEEAIEAAGLKDGMTISFHHHFRNGDYVMNAVIAAIARKGIKGLTLAPSSFLDTNDELIPFFQQGVLIATETSGLRNKLGHFLTTNHMARPTILRSHGGRVRAMESGELKIDVAFIGAPVCDTYGNINGVHGSAACGSMGYAMVDSRMADTVVAITDNLVEHPLCPVSIPQYQVDYIVKVDCIGDPKGISTGALRVTSNPRDLHLAKLAAKVIEHAGYFKEGFGMQLGAGAATVAAGKYLREVMLREQVAANFAIGGIVGSFCDLLDEGLIKTLFDVQSFDARTIQSLRDNPRHQEYDCTFYANPWNKGPMVNKLDYVVLGATEVDIHFNVNVMTDSNGIMMGALGGHLDASAGAKCTIICAPLLRGRLPMVTDAVQTVSTPGETVDIIVTDRGVAVNPKRQDLQENLKHSGLPLMAIEELRDMAYELGGKPAPLKMSDEIVAIVEYRDGTVLDVIRRPIV
ncbi:citrate lyase subunit alpha [Sporomusa sphaeroides]|uniref:Citrate lyase alpha chain n=1 Tax=Sporomusa sphaeroides DSM 2875 TaxID=1337886 RepID=A0ABM9W6X0_9FIRM|nr:citrate lyase subunit alpha [Sporomusa sphaeroides]OLS54704.1 citrate lyase alpha chain [Sporomusa sphaeroides DSM 2875]CVK20908.1 Citrate lyase alpha chain [Sporomusa sphaeroides DSM 2875]